MIAQARAGRLACRRGARREGEEEAERVVLGPAAFGGEGDAFALPERWFATVVAPGT